VGGVAGGVPGPAAGAAPRDAELKDGRLKKEKFAESSGADKLTLNAPALATPPPTMVAESVDEASRQAAASADDSLKSRAEPAAAPPPAEAAPGAKADAAKPSPAQGALRQSTATDNRAFMRSDVIGEFEAQASRPVRTAEEARAAAVQWQALADRHPQTRLADEARVRSIEAMATAFRLERKEADRDRARKAAEAYLAGTGAQKDRVRALLDQLGR
jgi:hypothetical protein